MVISMHIPFESEVLLICIVKVCANTLFRLMDVEGLMLTNLISDHNNVFFHICKQHLCLDNRLFDYPGRLLSCTEYTTVFA